MESFPQARYAPMHLFRRGYTDKLTSRKLTDEAFLDINNKVI